MSDPALPGNITHTQMPTFTAKYKPGDVVTRKGDESKEEYIVETVYFTDGRSGEDIRVCYLARREGSFFFEEGEIEPAKTGTEHSVRGAVRIDLTQPERCTSCDETLLPEPVSFQTGDVTEVRPV
jgi:hypothetical protein